MPNHEAEATRAPAKQEYSPDTHRNMVAIAAYYRAERRGFAPGDPTGDWLEAEAEIRQRIESEPDEEVSKAGGKQAFEQKLEAQIREWETKLEQLRSKAKEAQAELRAEFETQLETLAGKRAAAQQKLQELRQHGESAWEDLKDGADKAWKELRDAVERAASRLK